MLHLVGIVKCSSVLGHWAWNCLKLSIPLGRIKTRAQFRSLLTIINKISDSFCICGGGLGLGVGVVIIGLCKVIEGWGPRGDVYKIFFSDDFYFSLCQAQWTSVIPQYCVVRQIAVANKTLSVLISLYNLISLGLLL